MKTVLIVEDEKMIRKGISVIVSRSSISIEHILECRNGIEALSILEQEKVDVIFTDIRMPQMDGLQFVNQVKQRQYDVDIVVISGYDDFNYAVEMLKHGVHDYLLKPVKREKIEEILVVLEEKQNKKRVEKTEKNNMICEHMKYLLLHDQSEETWQKEFPYEIEFFNQESYRVVVSHQSFGCSSESIHLKEVEGQSVTIIKEKDFQNEMQGNKLTGMGVSSLYEEIFLLPKAYEEAKESRKIAFVTNEILHVYSPQTGIRRMEKREKEIFVEQFLNRMVAEEGNFVINDLRNLYFDAKYKKISSFDVFDITRDIIKKICEQYEPMMKDSSVKLLWIKNILVYESSKHFLFEFKNILNDIFYVQEQLGSSSERKIKMAMQYIEGNYNKDLNMAIVSNYISMNYSSFSCLFKEQTGYSFVEYLNKLRIDKAKELLVETELKILEIGKKVGYDNDKYFLKKFKMICGVSPSEYRNCHQNIN